MTGLSKNHELFARLSREDGAAIVALIDLKTEDDMDKVLNKLDLMQKSFDARFDAMQTSFDARLDAMDQKIDTKISTLYWAIGFAVTILALLRFFN